MSNPRNLAKSRYKWLGKWASRELRPGVAHIAMRHRDFDCMAESFAGTLYAIAREMDLKVSASVVGDSVAFAFFQPGAYLKPNLAAYPVVRKMRGGR